MTVYVPLERQPVTVSIEVGTDMPYVIVDSYGDKRERFATLDEAKAAARAINSGEI